MGLQTVIMLLWMKSSQQLLRSSAFIIYHLHFHLVCPWLLCSFVSWRTRKKSKEGILVWGCRWGVHLLLISSFKCRTFKSLRTQPVYLRHSCASLGFTREESQKYHIEPAYILTALTFHFCDFIALKLFLKGSRREIFCWSSSLKEGECWCVSFGLCFSWFNFKARKQVNSRKSSNFLNWSDSLFKNN